MKPEIKVIVYVVALAVTFVAWWLWQTWRTDDYVRRMKSRFHWREIEDNDD